MKTTYFRALRFLAIAAVLLTPCWVGCDGNPKLTAKIKKSAQACKPSDGFMFEAVHQQLQQENSLSILTPKIAFCCVMAEPNNENPLPLVTLIFVGTEQTADGATISFGDQKVEFPLGYWGFDQPDLLFFGGECTIDPTLMPNFGDAQEVRIFLTKEGEKFTEEVVLKPTKHEWEDRLAKEYVYPYPGEKYSPLKQKFPFNKPQREGFSF